MPTHYNYIITGAGCAGSSLLMRMMCEPFFSDKKILVIDQSEKKENDRTWCFWEKQAGLFESIVHHQWKKANFFSNDYSGTLNLDPYQYKMIRGIDLYAFVRKETAKHPNIEWRNEKITTIKNDGDKTMVVLSNEIITAGYVFNSILFQNIQTTPLQDEESGTYSLLQHFKGWLIQTKEPCFDAGTATLMDFRVNQEHGTTFIYLMPTSSATALVEYTLFTKELLPQVVYEDALRDYISSFLKIKEYTIEHEEFGIIPMTNKHFPLQDGRIIYMGIAGGQVKGSSGYAFQFIQKRTQAIVQSLIRNESPFMQRTLTDRKSHLYDSVLLNVLSNRKMNGDKIFARIFQKNSPKRVLQFLDNESSLYADFRIMQSVPAGIFLPAAIHEIIASLRRGH